tara:strand:- start:340 stop:1113 length:774 start_codon:yes stop_codon:yes gene_type:complete
VSIKQNNQFDIGIVVPCYNEIDRIHLSEFSQFLSSNDFIFICFVNDGSTDGTQKKLADFVNLNPKRSKLISLSENQGKAEAVRQGVITLLNSSRFQFIGYWDADLATPLTDIKGFIHMFKSNKELKVVCGSRILKLGSSIRRSVFRHYFGRIFATVVSIMLKIPVYDTQCGAKIFLAEYAEFIFSEKFLSRWFFDVELFARIIENIGRKNTINSVHELPLKKWHDQGHSKVTWTHVLQTPMELLRIYIFYRKRMEKS